MPNFYIPKKKMMIIGGIAVVVIIFAVIIIIDFLKPDIKPARVELEFWGVFDDSDVYQSLISQFQEQFPYTKITYSKKAQYSYEKDLKDALAAARGPDIFIIHNTWLPGYQDKIIPVSQEMPVSVDYPGLTDLAILKNFQETYVDVVISDFIADNAIWAMPLFVDTLALFYNKDLFNTVGIAQPPSTWKQFSDDVADLRIKNEEEDILRAGAAIGTARNINRSTDILSLLMIQTGAQMVNKQRTMATFDQKVVSAGQTFYPGQGALEFYTSFTNPDNSFYTWNNRMETHYSIDGFAEGNVAMMFSYAYQLPTIRAKSPYLNFGVASVPQPKTAAINVGYANYWGLAVAKNCQFDQEQPEACNRAWEFILWLNQKENTRQYLEKAKRPAARKDLIEEQKNDIDLGVFAVQSLSARSWYQVDSNAIETIMADMVESVVIGETEAKEAIEKAADQVTLLMKK